MSALQIDQACTGRIVSTLRERLPEVRETQAIRCLDSLNHRRIFESVQQSGERALFRDGLLLAGRTLRLRLKRIGQIPGQG